MAGLRLRGPDLLPLILGELHHDGAFRRETVVSTVTNDLLEIAVIISFPDRPGHLSATPVTLRTRYARGL